MTIGERIVELREERNLYQKDLASYLNLSIGTISNYENDIHDPDLDTLCKLADYFQVSADYLLGRSKHRHNAEILNKPIFRDYYIKDFVDSTLELSTKGRRDVLDFIELIQLREKAQPKNNTK